MKILDKYLLKTFLGTFFTVFIVLFFIFILQSVWLFISELAGKDLDFFMVVKFLMFATPRIIPLVLPLAVLLASIMSFGNLAENYEFAALKSAGISLQRAMKSLIVFISLLSIVAFVFANNVIPYAEFKFINFRKNIAQLTPALAIAEGQFSNIGLYSIKVNKKSGENGNSLTGITIHRKSSLGEGNKTVIKAKTGLLVSSEQSNTLQMILNNGYYYEDILPKNYEDRSKNPFAKSSFKRYNVNMDLSKMNKVGEENSSISNTSGMLNINELNYTLDSLKTDMKNEIVSFSDNINSQTGIQISQQIDTTFNKTKKIPQKLLSDYSVNEKFTILNSAINSIENHLQSITGTNTVLLFKQKSINSHILAFYDKFVIAYACFLMFFIGAPLGAIIRKGGIGLPIVFAVLIFITFHFINTFGKKISQEDGLPPILGVWLSSILLTPLAILLTYRATNDIGLINLDVITIPFQKIVKKIVQLQKKE